MKIIFTCGGTGGHINPALAVANLVRERDNNAEILFIGAENAMETNLVPREGYKIEAIAVRNLRHSISPGSIGYNLATVFKLAGSLGKAKKIIKAFKPDIVVGTGGYASFPAVYEATKLKIPTLIHESNAIPGITTNILAKRATKVMTGFSGVEKEYPRPEKVVVTGTPVREEILLADRKKARAELKLDERPVILSFFGSLGARDMNKAIADMLVEVNISGKYQHIHATGKFGWEWMPDLLKPVKNNPDIRLVEYIYDMPRVMAACDLIICRAGASTLSELSAAGKPAILVPSPNVSANHQEKNARKLAETGGVEVYLENEINGKKLFNISSELLRNNEKLDTMSKMLRQAAIVDAGDRIYKLIQDTVKPGLFTKNTK